MVFQPAPNCMEVVIHGTLHGKPVANVLNVQGSSPATPADVLAVAELVDAWMGAHWLALVSTQYSYTNVDVRGLDASSAPFITLSTHAGPGSEVEATPVSNQVTFSIKLATPLTGRSHRGRFYVAGLTDGDFDTANVLAASRANAWRDALRLLSTDLADEGHPLAIVSRVQGGVRLGTALSYVVTSIEYVDLRVDTLRRRLPE